MSALPRKHRSPGWARSVAFGRTPVIQAPELGARIMRYELADYEWLAIKPMLPNKPRGVPRVNDRRVLNGIFWVLRSGAPCRDLPEAFGPYTTCYNRVVGPNSGMELLRLVVPFEQPLSLTESQDSTSCICVIYGRKRMMAVTAQPEAMRRLLLRLILWQAARLRIAAEPDRSSPVGFGHWSSRKYRPADQDEYRHTVAMILGVPRAQGLRTRAPPSRR
jgi:transposase